MKPNTKSYVTLTAEGLPGMSMTVWIATRLTPNPVKIDKSVVIKAFPEG
jgi:hypothetical protein